MHRQDVSTLWPEPVNSELAVSTSYGVPVSIAALPRRVRGHSVVATDAQASSRRAHHGKLLYKCHASPRMKICAHVC